MIFITRFFLIASTTAICLIIACNGQGGKNVNSFALDSIYNAGTVKADSFKHTFYIKSTGTADLTIDTVVSSCECTIASWKKGPIRPGDSAYVNVSVMPDSAELGKHATKNVIVRTNAVKPLTIFTINYQL